MEKESSFVNNMKNATATISPIFIRRNLENCLELVERYTRDYLFKTIVPYRIVQRPG